MLLLTPLWLSGFVFAYISLKLGTAYYFVRWEWSKL